MAFYRCSGSGGNLDINGAVEQELYVQDNFSAGDIIYNMKDSRTETVEIRNNVLGSNYFKPIKKVVTLKNGKRYLFVLFTANSSGNTYGTLTYFIGELDDSCAVMQDTAVYQELPSYGAKNLICGLVLNTEEDLIIEMSTNFLDNGITVYGYMAVSFDLGGCELNAEGITHKIICSMYNYVLKKFIWKMCDRQIDCLVKVGKDAYVAAYTEHPVNSSKYKDCMSLFYKSQEGWAYKQYELAPYADSSKMTGILGIADGSKFCMLCFNANQAITGCYFGVYDEETTEITVNKTTTGHITYTLDLPSGESSYRTFLEPLKDNYYLLYVITVSNGTYYRHGFCKVVHVDFDNETIDSGFNSVQVTPEKFHYQHEPALGMHGSFIFWVGGRLFIMYRQMAIAELSIDYENNTIAMINNFPLTEYPTPSSGSYTKGWCVHDNMLAVPVHTDGNGFDTMNIYRIENDGVHIQSIVQLAEPMHAAFCHVPGNAGFHIMGITAGKLYMVYQQAGSSSNQNSTYISLIIANIFSGEALIEKKLGYADYYGNFFFHKGACFYDEMNNNFVMFGFNTVSYTPPNTSVTAIRLNITSYINAHRLSREGTIFGIAGEDIAKQEKGMVYMLPVEYRSLETEAAALSDEVAALSESTDNLEGVMDTLLTSI